MSDEELQTDTYDREHREQWEQPNNDVASVCLRPVLIGKEVENNLVTKIEIPVKAEPIELSYINLNRPCFMSHKDELEINGKRMKPGVYWHDLKEGLETNEWICGPLSIEAITSSEEDDEYGRLLIFQNSNGKWRKWPMPMQMLKARGDELIGELLRLGLDINHKKRQAIIAYISGQTVNKRITCVSSIGWHKDSFVLPNHVIGGSDVVFQSEVASNSEFRTAGTIDSWKQEIGKLCMSNIPLIVSVSVALAGPLLKRLNQQGFCIHWVGDSSSGKTTAAEIAASVWGPQEIIRSWRSTSNGMEAIAAARNDTCLVLDEIGEASPNDIGNISYLLSNGHGRQRAARNGKARDPQRWRLSIISTGEKTLAGIMNEVGKVPQTGQEVRLLSVPALFEYGVFSDLHGFENGRKFADHLKAARSRSYGQIGPAFIGKLINEKRDLLGRLQLVVKKICEDAKTSIEGRAASSFAITGLAGELAIEYDLLPWEAGSALNAALLAYRRWKEFQGATQTEDEKILQSVRSFVNKHGDSRFSKIDGHSEKPIINRAGFYKDTKDGRTYMLFSEALVEASGGYHITRIGKALDQAGWIIEKDKNRLNKKVRIPHGTKYMYFICETDK